MLCKPEEDGFRRTSPLPVVTNTLRLFRHRDGTYACFLSFDIGFRHWYDVVGAGAEEQFFLREYL